MGMVGRVDAGRVPLTAEVKLWTIDREQDPAQGGWHLCASLRQAVAGVFAELPSTYSTSLQERAT